MRVGVLTGGGDCPGLNAVIRALVRRRDPEYGYEFVGFRDGWRGPLEGDTMPLDVQAVRGILPRGGTILGSSRTNPLADSASAGGRSGLERIKDNLAALGIDALVAIGGEDTLGVAARLYEEGVRVVGVPKTIDNDLGATDYTFGFDTAVNIAMEAIDRLHTTAESHHRALIVEVMGRHAGWIALHAGMAGGANVILIPEQPFDIEQVCAYVQHRFQTRYAPIVVVAEGAHPEGRTMDRCSTSSWTRSVTSATAGSGSCWPTRSRSAPARRPAPRCSATSSAAAPRPRSTGCWPPASARTRSARWPTGRSARWWPCAARTSSGCRWPRPPGSSSWCRPSATPRPRSSSARPRP